MQQTYTTSHEEIRAWAQGRGGMPAIVEGTDADLRFDWGEGDADTLRLSWAEFFDIFEEQGLAFAHIEQDDSSVYEFVPRQESAIEEYQED